MSVFLASLLGGVGVFFVVALLIYTNSGAPNLYDTLRKWLEP